MNDNPWHVESIARAQRDRIQEEMRQIRLEEAAQKNHMDRPSLMLQIQLLARRWFQRRTKQAARPVERRVVQATGAKHHAGI